MSANLVNETIERLQRTWTRRDALALHEKLKLRKCPLIKENKRAQAREQN